MYNKYNMRNKKKHRKVLFFVDKGETCYDFARLVVLSVKSR